MPKKKSENLDAMITTTVETKMLVKECENKKKVEKKSFDDPISKGGKADRFKMRYYSPTTTYNDYNKRRG